MNCQSCNTRIDYRFLTNCEHCGGEAPQIEAPRDLPSVPLIERTLTWTQRLLNLGYVFASSFVGMISGAVVLYFLGAIFYMAFIFDEGLNASDRCAQGNAFGFLSILFGAFLGTMGGSAFAVKKPLAMVYSGRGATGVNRKDKETSSKSRS